MTGIMQSALGNWNVPSAAAAASLVYNLDGTLGALPGASITTSASFNGSTQYLNIANTSALGLGTGDFTIEYWWRPTSSVRSDVVDLWGTGGGGANNATRLIFGSSVTGSNLGIWVDSTPTGIVSNLISGPTLASLLNSWHHIALTRQSGSIYLWVDGTQAGSTYSAATLDFGASQAMNIMGDHGAGSGNGSGNLSNLRVVLGTALYTTTFTPPTVTLRAVSGTAVLLPLTATPFTDMSTNLLAVTNNGTTVTSAQAPTLTAATTDFTGTYTITTANAGASVSYNSANGGVFAKSNATGTDVIYGGPSYVTGQSYTVFMAYQLSATSAGRLLNTQNEAVKDWLMGAYNGNPNTFYPNFSVNLPGSGADTAWHFGWATWDTTTSTGQLWIATNTQPTTYTYTATNAGGGGFNQLRLFSRSSGSEVQSGNIGFVKVYNGVLNTATIQAQYAAFKTRFGY